MLSKVNKDNWETHGTPNIINFALNNKFDLIQDNLENYLLVKSNSQTYLYDCKTNKKINKSTIKLNILDKYFWKSIESFDQNNILIANNIRLYVIKQFDYELNTNKIIPQSSKFSGKYFQLCIFQILTPIIFAE